MPFKGCFALGCKVRSISSSLNSHQVFKLIFFFFQFPNLSHRNNRNKISALFWVFSLVSWQAKAPIKVLSPIILKAPPVSLLTPLLEHLHIAPGCFQPRLKMCPDAIYALRTCVLHVMRADRICQRNLVKNLLDLKMEIWHASKGKVYKSNIAGVDFLLESHKAAKSQCILASFLTPFLLSTEATNLLSL